MFVIIVIILIIYYCLWTSDFVSNKDVYYSLPHVLDFRGDWDHQLADQNCWNIELLADLAEALPAELIEEGRVARPLFVFNGQVV